MQQALAARLGPDRGGRGPAGALGAGADEWQDGPIVAAATRVDGRSAGTGRTLCLLDGRITNLGELRRLLAMESGDAERVIAAGHERWGEDVVGRCAGQFTLLVWDRDERRGFVARDPLGHRSVFFRADGASLVLASEIRPVLAMLPSHPGPDRLAATHWLAGTGLPAGHTLYEGIARLAPGHLLRIGGGTPSARRYWEPWHGTPRIRDFTEASEAIRAGLEASVARALQDAERPAVLLSGGLDSGSVAVVAARSMTGTRPAAAYSTVFPGHPEVDESSGIASSRSAAGLAGVERRFAAGSAVGPSLEFLRAHAVPSASPNAFLWRPLLRRAAADGITTVLDGEGGDELFGCAPFLLADAVRRGHLPAAVRLARSIPGMGEHPRPAWIRRALRTYGLRGALPAGPHAVLRRLRHTETRTTAWLCDDVARLHAASTDPWSWKRERGPRWRANLLHTIVDLSDAMGAHDQFRRESQLSGVAFRHPLRDPLLLDVVLQLDPALAFDANLDRPVARAAMRGLLPDAVRLADRKPNFNAPLLEALAGPDAPTLHALLGDPASRVRAYVRGDALDDRLSGDPARLRGRPLLELWRALTLECWLRFAEDADTLDRLIEPPRSVDDRFATV